MAGVGKEDVLKEVLFVPVCVGLPLLLLGALGVSLYDNSSVRHSISEAVLVAGVIITFVDPVLKWRLLHEFARDLFPHMIGFGLPSEIKDRLRLMVTTTKLYRKDMTMKLDFSPTQQQGEVQLRFTTEFKLVNPTSSLLSYKHHLAFEEAERTYDVQVTLPNQNNPLPITAISYPCGVGDYLSDEISIDPSCTYSFKSEYSQTYTTMGFHVQTFGFPTIGFTLSVTSTFPGLEVRATPRDASPNEECQELGTREYKQLFMKGDSIIVRWRLKKQGN